VLGPTQSPAVDLHTQSKLLIPVIANALQSALEVEHAANELADRYEEINLLYTISEILGRTVALEEATARILTEISETVGARKAAVLVHDATANSLIAVAVLGAPAESMHPIPVDDTESVSARVFRSAHPLLL
jgi:sigma-B regulation protein RsbU (phosphoserine phosphatase)